MAESNVFKQFQAGDIIMRQGDAGHEAYIIEKGRVEILVKQESGKELSIGTRGEGAMIGEMALVDQAPRTATIRAIEDCEFLVISGDDFEKRIEQVDPILKMAMHVILARYRDTLMRAEITGERHSAEAIELDYAGASTAVERVKLANELKHALDKGQLSLQYQPIVRLVDGQTAGFEALMRWQHPEKGFISPGLFIPAAEETGLINELSEWALNTSCKALKRIETESGRAKDNLFMSVNFSASDFERDDFVDLVTHATQANKLKAHQLHIEITERLLMAKPDQAKQTLNRCANAGFHVSIDDFGTGYSSLSYLRHFPLHTLKVDRSFVIEMMKDEGSMTLVKSIVNLGKNMGMSIIAEGVENADEVQALREMDCDMVQGYFFSKPRPEDDAIDFVRVAKAAEQNNG